jgi:G patch domain-containing protein 1
VNNSGKSEISEVAPSLKHPRCRFHPPKVPDGWEPDPRRVWNKDSSAATQSPPVPVVAAKPQVHPSRAAFLKNALNADQRGAALGETPLPAAPKSVFDYLSPKDRERLQKLASTNLAIPSSSSSSSSAQQEIPPVTEDLTSIPRLDSFIAQQALKGFQPFQRDAEKAARYNAYLRSQLGELGNDDDSSVVLRPGPYQSKEEFYKELREFAKSATIFKPATGALGGRFASAKVIESLDIGKDGLFVPGPDSESASVNYLGDEVKQEKEAKKEDPIVEAARLGMFGPLTRTVKEWTPARLLCKRFGVKEPVREEAMDVDADKQDWRAQLPSQDQISQLTTLQQPNDKVMRAATSSFRGQGRDISNIGLGEDDEQGKEILTYTKPERDIFKAIFESDEEDEPEEVEEETKAPALSVPSTTGVDLPISKPTIEAVPSGSLIVDVYIPKDSAKQESLDLSSFRPTFKSKARDYKGDKKDKEKKKSSKKGKAILSFDADDAEGPAISPAKPKKQKKDKPKAKEVALVEDDDAMWVEKPAPAVAATFATSMTGSEGVLRPPEVQPSKPTGRMKASDFI